MNQTNFPLIALSVRQPSAWAIIHGGKDIENRSIGSVRAGRMEPGRICLHAAVGMSQDEYRYITMRMGEIGCVAPPPGKLVRRAIIGIVDVVDIVKPEETDSLWMARASATPESRGLVLENPQPIEPIPAAGALGYFEWEESGELAPVQSWMRKWDETNGDAQTGSLFDGLERSFETPPKRPW
ncbi:MAG: hypothetical protein AAGH90_12985 [Pseudomonadota bacterium]